MIDKDELLDICFEVIKECMDTITLPTGKTLLPTFVFSLFIFLVSFVCSSLELLTLVRWQGALIATILLGGLCVVEARGENNISKLYRKAKHVVTKPLRAPTVEESSETKDSDKES